MSSSSSNDGQVTQPEIVGLDRTSFAAGTVLSGRYRIERLIGEGGMGDVYLAEDLKIDKSVAVKLLAPEQMRRSRTVSRFLQEAKAASKIRHENVVDITDYGEAEGCAFYVMEYLEGEDLDKMLQREKRVSWERARRISVQLLEALAAAHKADVIHRDIKPHNCFLTPREHNPDFVKVIDFGIAKLRGDGSKEQLTRTGAIMGTAEYMSPEQGLGQDIDGRSDLYSVGVILYRMLTGEVPFTGSNPMGVLYQHIHAKLVPPSEACPDSPIGPQLDALVGRALAKDPDERFATAEEFIEAIEAVDDPRGENVGPPRPRNGWRVGVAVLALLVATGAAWAWSQAEPTEPPESVGANAAAAAVHPEPSTEPEKEKAVEVSPAEAAPEAKAEPVVREPPEEAPPAEDEEPADAEDAPDQPAGSTPARRSSRALRAAFAKVSGKVSHCGTVAGLFPGEKVDVEVKIAPNGKVTSASVEGTMRKAGKNCIAKAVRKARLGPAARVQTAKYEFRI